jgi:hypothetical protein
MTELAIELPQGQAKIEWNKLNPTFKEVKDKLQSCGISKNSYVQMLQNDEFITPNDNWQIKNSKKIFLRVAPITNSRLKEGASTNPCYVDSPINGLFLMVHSKLYNYT